MKSIKRGRGPSAFNVFGSILAVAFGIFWTIMATQMGAPIYFVFFGIIFIVAAIGQGIYNYINATSKNRFSEFDITDDTEEKDAFEEIFHRNEENIEYAKSDGNMENETDYENHDEMRYDVHFCSNCGAPVEINAKFCSNCGKRIS